MASLALKLNFIRGWPNPHIDEFVSNNTPTSVAVDEGKIAHRDSTGAWALGISTVGQTPYVLWNGAASNGDQGVAFSSSANFAQARYGGIQGVSLNNPIEFETAQYGGTPTFGQGLYAHTDGKLYPAVEADGSFITGAASKPIVAYVTQGVHSSPGGQSFITVVPDNSRRLSPAS
jgi:hypothetical protein